MQTVGLMSGTSLDGLTIAQASIADDPPKTIGGLKRAVREARFVASKTYKFPDVLRDTLAYLAEPTNSKKISTKLISSASVELGKFATNCLKQFIRKESKTSIDLVAFHGQTIYHEPGSPKGRTITLQIGDPSPICYGLNVPVVSDFRSMDTSSGGQGAPLVPIADYLRYSNETNRIILNIGGIANFTFLPKGGKLSEVRAFDVGPGNILIDGALIMVTKSRLSYDDGGRLASSGKKSEELFNWILRKDAYRFLPIPKSTGRERYNLSFVKELVQKARKLKLSNSDLIATVAAYTVFMIDCHLKFVEGRGKKKIEEIIVGGGGTRNSFIMDALTNLRPGMKVSTHDEYGIPSWCWESFAFSVIAYLTFHRTTGNLPSATGARASVVLGRVNYPPSVVLS